MFKAKFSAVLALSSKFCISEQRLGQNQYRLMASVAKCRGSWVVGRGRGSWVWVVGVCKCRG